MIRFTVGLVLLVFSVLIGFYQYDENVNRLRSEQSRLTRTQQQKVEAGQLQKRLAALKEKLMVRGDDQKSKIERTLNLSDTRLQFKFNSQGNPNDPSSKNFYRHEFELVGPSTYYKILETINQLENTPGVVIYSACVGCINPPSNVKLTPEEHMVLIKGYIYVNNMAG